MLDKVIKDLKHELVVAQQAVEQIQAALTALGGKNGRGRPKGSTAGTKGKGDTLYLIMQAHPEGLTAAGVREQLDRAGVETNRSTAHNLLRDLTSKGHKLIKTASGHGHKTVYRLAKPGQAGRAPKLEEKRKPGSRRKELRPKLWGGAKVEHGTFSRAVVAIQKLLEGSTSGLGVDMITEELNRLGFPANNATVHSLMRYMRSKGWAFQSNETQRKAGSSKGRRHIKIYSLKKAGRPTPKKMARAAAA